MRKSDLIFTLDNFEGPLYLLWSLIERDEIDIQEIPIHKITNTCLNHFLLDLETEFDSSVEFINWIIALMYSKSKSLLPVFETTDEEEEGILDQNGELIQHLIDYYTFKQAAKQLAEREESQLAFYSRGVSAPIEEKRKSGLESLSLDHLASAFQKILLKSTPNKKLISDEIWTVADQIKKIRSLLQTNPLLFFDQMFAREMCREELIVTFLAILEVIKLGEIKVYKNSENKIFISSNEGSKKL